MATLAKFYSGTSDQLDSKPIENGALYITTDTSKLAVDLGNTRLYINGEENSSSPITLDLPLTKSSVAIDLSGMTAGFKFYISDDEYYEASIPLNLPDIDIVGSVVVIPDSISEINDETLQLKYGATVQESKLIIGGSTTSSGSSSGSSGTLCVKGKQLIFTDFNIEEASVETPELEDTFLTYSDLEIDNENIATVETGQVEGTILTF